MFSLCELDELKTDFGRIAAQLQGSQKDVSTQWQGVAMERLGAKNTVVVHTHNVQNYSFCWSMRDYPCKAGTTPRAVPTR